MEWLVEAPEWRDRTAFEYVSLWMTRWKLTPSFLQCWWMTQIPDSFSDVFFCISFERGLPPLASESRLSKVETFFQIKSFPSQKCQTQLSNVIMVLQPSRVREAFDSNILMLRPWKKDLRSKQGALGNCEMTGFALQHSLEPAFCLQAAKSHCSTWWSQVSQKAAAEGSAHLICHQPLVFFQNNEKHTWPQIWSNWQAFLFGSSLILNKHKI